MNRPREDGKLFFFWLNYSYQCWPDGPLGTYTLFYNIFYKNIEAEICEILRIILRIKPRLRFLKRIDIILCVEASVNTIQFSFVFFNRIKKAAEVDLCDAPHRPIPKPGKSPWERGCNHHREHTIIISVLSVVVAIKLPKKKMKMRMGWMEC